MNFNAKTFSTLTNTTLLRDGNISNVVFDSRKVEKNTMFVCVKGENTDGHNFIASAIENGASAILINEEKKAEVLKKFKNYKGAIISSNDSFNSLKDFARIMHDNSKGTYIGLTGSCGKTTTKEMIASILSQLGSTVKTPGNLNSEYGLTLSMLDLEKNTKFGVFEFGIDRVGEMERMKEVCPLDYALITNIGISHLEEFGQTEIIAREKSQILTGNTKAFIPSLIRHKDIIKEIKGELNEFTSNIFDSVEHLGFEGWKVKLGKEQFIIPLLGEHIIKNASAAISLTREIGASDREIAEGLKAVEPIFGRSRIIKEGDVTVIEDCYNATLDSTKDAIKTINSLPWSGTKRIILGDMKELGKDSRKAHALIGRAILNNPVNGGVYLYGEEMENTYRVLYDKKVSFPVTYTDNYEDLERCVSNDVKRGDLVLLKGSRAMRMERLYSAIKRVS